jgi:hypothetical protein
MKAVCSIKMFEATWAMTWHHVPEHLNLQRRYDVHVSPKIITVLE